MICAVSAAQTPGYAMLFSGVGLPYDAIEVSVTPPSINDRSSAIALDEVQVRDDLLVFLPEFRQSSARLAKVMRLAVTSAVR